MSLQPAQFSGETSGANARLADPAAMSQPELNAVASGDKVTGGRRRKSGRKSSRKAKSLNANHVNLLAKLLVKLDHGSCCKSPTRPFQI